MSGAEPAAEERGSGAYREPGVVPSFPAEQIAWRRSVAQGALWVMLVLLAKYAVVSAMAASPVVAAAVLTPLEIALCFATWKLTAREPGQKRALWLGWLLRAIVVAGALMWPLGLLGLEVRQPAAISMLAAAGVGLLYVAHLFGAFEAPRHVWLARASALVWLVVALPLALGTELYSSRVLQAVMLVGALLLGLYCLVRLAFVLRVTGSEIFWRDETEAPPEWVALFVLADRRAEAFDAGGRLGYFASRDDAEAWLGEHGMIQGEALAAQAE